MIWVLSFSRKKKERQFLLKSSYRARKMKMLMMNADFNKMAQTELILSFDVRGNSMTKVSLGSCQEERANWLPTSFLFEIRVKSCLLYQHREADMTFLHVERTITNYDFSSISEYS
jgi:hypothetical protein